jgi:DNA (cytosine-5)-methyltransferase 1
VDAGLFLPVAHSLRAEGFDASEDGTGRGTPLVPVLAGTLKANNGGGGFGSDPSETFIPVAIQERAVSENLENGPQGKGYQEYIAFTLEARNKAQAVAFDTTQITSKANRSNPQPGDPCHPIAAGAHPPAVAYRTNAAGQVDAQGEVAEALITQTGPCTQFVAFSCKDCGADAAETSPTLRAMSHSGSHANAGGQVAVAFYMRGREGGSMPEGCHDTANIRAASGGSSRSYIAAPMAVRRLTPRECERLQGFPDDYTLIPWRGKPAELCPDGNRYKALGNSMAVPVMHFIGKRIMMAESMGKDVAA